MKPYRKRTKKCWNCDNKFFPKNSKGLFCSTKCRLRYRRKQYQLFQIPAKSSYRYISGAYRTLTKDYAMTYQILQNEFTEETVEVMSIHQIYEYPKKV